MPIYHLCHVEVQFAMFSVQPYVVIMDENVCPTPIICFHAQHFSPGAKQRIDWLGDRHHARDYAYTRWNSKVPGLYKKNKNLVFFCKHFIGRLRNSPLRTEYNTDV